MKRELYSNQMTFYSKCSVCVCVCVCVREREREREREIPSSTLKPFTIQYVFLNCNNNSIVSIKVRFRYTK